MNPIVRQLQELAESDLYALIEAVDMELRRRAKFGVEIFDSARRRANERKESYRRRIGSAAPPVREIGIAKLLPRRRAA